MTVVFLLVCHAATPTMMPSVPSEPTNSCVRSGPTAARGAPPVVISVPSASTTSRPVDDVLDLAVARRELAGAAAREPTADGRQRHRLRPVPAGDAVRRRGARPRTRRRTCRAARRRASRCVSTPTMPSSAVRSSSTPPNTGTLAPHTPLRPAAAVTGTRASLHSRSTARDLVGGVRAARPPTPAPRPASSSAQIIASGHQSRLASPISAGGVDHVGAGCARAASRSASSTSTRARLQMRSRTSPVAANAIGGVGAPRLVSIAAETTDSRRRVRRARRARSRAARPSSRSVVDQRPVLLDLAVALGVASSRARRAISVGDVVGGRGRRVAGEQAGPCAAREHVVDGARHLGARRVHDLGLRVRRGRATIGSASAGSARSSASTVACVAAVALGEVLRDVGRVPAVGAVQADALRAAAAAAAAEQLRPPRRPRRRPCAGRS